jgi:hypothetical protein
VKFPHESFLFWRFAFNSAKTGAKSQLVPLNQKLTIMPKSGISQFSVNARKLPDFCPTLFLALKFTF